MPETKQLENTPPSQRYPGWCSFCQKNYRQVGPLVEGPDQHYICFQCVELSTRILELDIKNRRELRKEDATEATLADPSVDFLCSFCQESFRSVGPLIEGPDNVYICFRCLQFSATIIEAEWRRVGKNPPKDPDPLVERIAQLSELKLNWQEYYREFLRRMMAVMAAPGGAVWLLYPGGELQLHNQINLDQLALDHGENVRQMHNELLCEVAIRGMPAMVMPHGKAGHAPGTVQVAVNPTDYLILFAPILCNKQVVGLVEAWENPTDAPETQRGFLNCIIRMVVHASEYARTALGPWTRVRG